MVPDNGLDDYGELMTFASMYMVPGFKYVVYMAKQIIVKSVGRSI